MAGRPKKEVLVPGKEQELDKYEIVPDGTFSYYKIKRSSGGVPPKELAGSYTTKGFAEKAIFYYMTGLRHAKR